MSLSLPHLYKLTSVKHPRFILCSTDRYLSGCFVYSILCTRSQRASGGRRTLRAVGPQRRTASVRNTWRSWATSAGHTSGTPQLTSAGFTCETKTPFSPVNLLHTLLKQIHMYVRNPFLSLNEIHLNTFGRNFRLSMLTFMFSYTLTFRLQKCRLWTAQVHNEIIHMPLPPISFITVRQKPFSGHFVYM